MPSLPPSSACKIFCSTRRRRIRLPNSMSELPALRGFIFFAADLFTLVYLFDRLSPLGERIVSLGFVLDVYFCLVLKLPTALRAEPIWSIVNDRTKLVFS